MWKYDSAVGVIKKIVENYIVVKWDNVPGEWHYTEDQSKRLKVEEIKK